MVWSFSSHDAILNTCSSFWFMWLRVAKISCTQGKLCRSRAYKRKIEKRAMRVTSCLMTLYLKVTFCIFIEPESRQHNVTHDLLSNNNLVIPILQQNNDQTI